MKVFGTIDLLFFLAAAGFLFMPVASQADTVINENLIVAGSACVGFDCAENETFGFDTIRLKENNLQIDFMDTSSTSGFPTNDWRIKTNDSTNGGRDYFSIIDAGADGIAAETVMRIYAGDQGGVELGRGSSAGSNGVALGVGSVADDNTVSVGSAGSERRVTNVANAELATDAVNLGQLESVSTRVYGVESRVEDVEGRIDGVSSRIGSVEKKAYAGIAASMAMAAVPDPMGGHRFSAGMGVGHYAGLNAIAIGAKADVTNNLRIGGSMGYSRSNTAVSAGAGFSW